MSTSVRTRLRALFNPSTSWTGGWQEPLPQTLAAGTLVVGNFIDHHQAGNKSQIGGVEQLSKRALISVSTERDLNLFGRFIVAGQQEHSEGRGDSRGHTGHAIEALERNRPVALVARVLMELEQASERHVVSRGHRSVVQFLGSNQKVRNVGVAIIERSILRVPKAFQQGVTQCSRVLEPAVVEVDLEQGQ